MSATTQTDPPPEATTNADEARLGEALAQLGRGARPADRDARGDPRAADDVHRLRLSLAEDVRAAQRRRPCRGARAGRPIPPAATRLKDRPD